MAPAPPAPACRGTPDEARAEFVFRALLAQWPDGATSVDVQFDPCATTRSVATVEGNGRLVRLDLRELAGASDAVLTFAIGHELGHILQMIEGEPVAGVYAREALAHLAAFELAQCAGLRIEDLRPVLAFLASRDQVLARVVNDVRSVLAVPDRDERFAALARVIPGLALISPDSNLGRVIRPLVDTGWPWGEVQL